MCVSGDECEWYECVVCSVTLCVSGDECECVVLHCVCEW